MRSTTKSALVLLATLLLGIAIGVLAWSTVHNRQMERIRSLRRSGAMTESIRAVVQPVDSTQDRALTAMVGNLETEMSGLYHEFGERRSQLFDSLRTELKTILTPRQSQKLDDWMAHNRRSSRRTGSPHDSG